MRSETSKEDKIAAAKQKLKEFQTKKDQYKSPSNTPPQLLGQSINELISEDNADTASISSSIIAIDNDKFDDEYYQKQIANLEDLLKNAENKIGILEDSNKKLSEDYVSLQKCQSKQQSEINDKIEIMNMERNSLLETIKLKDEENEKNQKHSELQESGFLKQIENYENLIQQLEEDLKIANDKNKMLLETNSSISLREQNLIKHIDNIENANSKLPCTSCEALEKDNIELKSLVEKIKQNNNNNDDIQIKINAMEKLGEKFNKMMQNFANLTEDKQHLEHLVQQLQCETDTIGEYITLYREQKVKLDRKIDFYNHKISQFYTTKEQLTHLISNVRDFLQAHRYVLGDKIDFNYIENICLKLGHTLQNISDSITSDFVSDSQSFRSDRVPCDGNKEKCYSCSGQMFIV